MALSKAKNFKNFISLWFCDVNSAIHTRLCFLFQLYRLQVIFYLLLFVICLFVAVIYLFTRNTSTICEMSSNLVKTVLAFLIFFVYLKPISLRVLVFLVEYELVNVDWLPEAALHRCSYEKLFWKCAANVQENNGVEVWFQ